MFVKDSKTVILMKKGHDGEEEKENKNQGFSKKKSVWWTRSIELGQLDQIFVNKNLR
jgi:hypothetical protein